MKKININNNADVVLAQLLTSLRNGDDVIVSQEGYDDLYIPAYSIKEVVATYNAPKGTKNATGVTFSSNSKDVIKKAIIASIQPRTAKFSYEQAKARTRSKHARILKALEDK